MRIRIIQKPSEARIDGLRLDRFDVGQQYEIGSLLGAVFLAEGWAEPVDDNHPALVIPLDELKSHAPEPLSPNPTREPYPPYYEPAIALDRRRGSRHGPD